MSLCCQALWHTGYHIVRHCMTICCPALWHYVVRHYDLTGYYVARRYMALCCAELWHMAYTESRPSNAAPSLYITEYNEQYITAQQYAKASPSHAVPSRGQTNFLCVCRENICSQWGHRGEGAVGAELSPIRSADHMQLYYNCICCECMEELNP